MRFQRREHLLPAEGVGQGKLCTKEGNQSMSPKGVSVSVHAWGRGFCKDNIRVSDGKVTEVGNHIM